MSAYYADELVTLHLGDCRDVLATLPDASVDSVVTDPPYELGFMARKWDATGIAYDPQVWAECLRVLKPGGHLLAFGGSRTWHRLASAIEDAGFDLRDSIAWLYGSGFPKSLDVSKAIDKAAGAAREVIGTRVLMGTAATEGPAKGTLTGVSGIGATKVVDITAPATFEAVHWQGWGTALKPAFEPIVVARKPLAGTVAANVLAHGTGALNIDGCRIEGAKPDTTRGASVKATSMAATLGGQGRILDDGRGRWPANVLLDESQAEALDGQSGATTSRIGNPRGAGPGDGWGMTATGAEYADSGGASRFFPTFRYEAKAPTSQRPRVDGAAHPTVKPLDLMRWLVRLVTPPGGTVLEPFAGSGTTAEACIIEGFKCIAVEREADYLPLILARITKPIAPVLDFGGAA